MNKVEEIKQLHQQINANLRLSLGKAMQIGKLLTEQKAEIGHGGWQEWVRENLPFSPATARNYMRLHKEREKFKTLNVSGLADAYKMLYGTKPAKKPKPKPDPAGDPPPQREFLSVTKAEAKQLNDLLRWIGEKVTQTTSVKATLFAALQYIKEANNG